MPKGAFRKALAIAGLIVTAYLAILGLVGAFGYYISLGELSSWPPGGEVTVVLSRSQLTDRIMSEVCQFALAIVETPPKRYKPQYDSLLRTGALGEHGPAQTQ
jgi:hypothetical protein